MKAILLLPDLWPVLQSIVTDGYPEWVSSIASGIKGDSPDDEIAVAVAEELDLYIAPFVLKASPSAKYLEIGGLVELDMTWSEALQSVAMEAMIRDVCQEYKKVSETECLSPAS